VADLDLDGKPDLVVTRLLSESVAVLLQRSGVCGPAVDYPTNGPPKYVAAGDLNDDGNPDLATANDNTATISVRLGDGHGGFGPRIDSSSLEFPKSISIADFNGDGNNDVAVANAGQAALLLGQGDGSFGGKSRLGVMPYSGFVASVDANDDDHADLVSWSFSTQLGEVFLGDGAGGFERSAEFPVGNNPIGLTSGDLNADHHIDFVITRSSSISVLLGEGDGRFKQPVEYSTLRAGDTAIGDVNGDGKTDIVAVQSFAPTLLWLGRGDGSFDAGTPIQGSEGGNAVVLADVGGDGQLDLVIASVYARAVSVQEGHGDGTFGSPSNYPLSGPAWHLEVVDMSADGTPDIVVTVDPMGVAVLTGRGDGTFGATLEFAVGRDVNRMAVGDVNGDGRPDIATANVQSRSVTVLLKNGAGGFDRVDYGTGSIPVVLTIADLNGDRRPDLAVGGFLGDHITLLWNQGRRVPIAVEDLAAEAIQGAVRLTWSMSPEAWRSLLWVRVERAAAFQGPYTECPGSPLTPARTMTLQDDAVVPGNTYWYRLVLAGASLTPTLSRPVRVDVPDGQWRTTLQVPMSEGREGRVRVSYRVGPTAAVTQLAIFDVRGQRVRLLEREHRQPGSYVRSWDRRDNAGRRVARGLYIVQLQAGPVSASHKLLLND
jgi:hypothetical protein